MKMHKTLFIIGLAVFAMPFLGLPGMLETILFAAFGISIMLIVSTIKKSESSDEVEILEEKTEPTYSEITDQVKEELSEIDETEDEEKSE